GRWSRPTHRDRGSRGARTDRIEHDRGRPPAQPPHRDRDLRKPGPAGRRTTSVRGSLMHGARLRARRTRGEGEVRMKRLGGVAVALMMLIVGTARGQTVVKPGFNMFSVDQDAE